jgi:hypothetical protein
MISVCADKVGIILLPFVDYTFCKRDVCVCVCVCLLLQYLIQCCARGGRRIVEDMCYEIRRAEACVD